MKLNSQKSQELLRTERYKYMLCHRCGRKILFQEAVNPPGQLVIGIPLLPCLKSTKLVPGPLSLKVAS